MHVSSSKFDLRVEPPTHTTPPAVKRCRDIPTLKEKQSGSAFLNQSRISPVGAGKVGFSPVGRLCVYVGGTCPPPRRRTSTSTPIVAPASGGWAHYFLQVTRHTLSLALLSNFSRSRGQAPPVAEAACAPPPRPPSRPYPRGPGEGRAPARAQGTRAAGQGGRRVARRVPPASPLPAGGAAPAAAPPLARREPEGLCQPAADLPGCAPRPVSPSSRGCRAEGGREIPGRAAPRNPPPASPRPAPQAWLCSSRLCSRPRSTCRWPPTSTGGEAGPGRPPLPAGTWSRAARLRAGERERLGPRVCGESGQAPGHR